MKVQFLPGYRAALETTAYLPVKAGYLRIAGETRQEFLQRQTSNDLSQLAAGQILLNVLTSPVGRILEVFYLWPENDTEIGAILLAGHALTTFQYFRSRIFFMDRVTISDQSENFAQIDLYGPQAPAVLQSIGLEQPPGESQISFFEFANQPAFILAHAHAIGSGYRLVVPAQSLESAGTILEQHEAARLEPESAEILRLEAGLPGAGHELTEEYTPLEARLEQAVSTGKGCYTGQEVLARQINYDKITRRLVVLQLATAVDPGVDVFADGKAAGKVTSAVLSPRFGPLALAMLRRPFNQTGTVVNVDGQTGYVRQPPFE